MSLISEDKQQIESERVLEKYDHNKYMGKAPKTLTCAILGDKGTGKTLFMAIISLIYQVAKLNFYTNFWLKEKINFRHDFNLKQMYRNPNVSGIFLDEVHNIADQNSNNSLETSLLIALFSQSRKRNQLILLSSLRFYKMAKDLRNMVNILIYPDYDEKKDILDLTFWDIRTDKVITKRIKKVSKFFKYYNTYEIIVSEQIKSQLSNFLLKDSIITPGVIPLSKESYINCAIFISKSFSISFFVSGMSVGSSLYCF